MMGKAIVSKSSDSEWEEEEEDEDRSARHKGKNGKSGGRNKTRTIAPPSRNQGRGKKMSTFGGSEYIQDEEEDEEELISFEPEETEARVDELSKTATSKEERDLLLEALILYLKRRLALRS